MSMPASAFAYATEKICSPDPRPFLSHLANLSSKPRIPLAEIPNLEANSAVSRHDIGSGRGLLLAFTAYVEENEHLARELFLARQEILLLQAQLELRSIPRRFQFENDNTYSEMDSLSPHSPQAFALDAKQTDDGHRPSGPPRLKIFIPTYEYEPQLPDTSPLACTSPTIYSPATSLPPLPLSSACTPSSVSTVSMSEHSSDLDPEPLWLPSAHSDDDELAAMFAPGDGIQEEAHGDSVPESPLSTYEPGHIPDSISDTTTIFSPSVADFVEAVEQQDMQPEWLLESPAPVFPDADDLCSPSLIHTDSSFPYCDFVPASPLLHRLVDTRDALSDSLLSEPLPDDEQICYPIHSSAQNDTLRFPSFPVNNYLTPSTPQVILNIAHLETTSTCDDVPESLMGPVVALASQFEEENHHQPCLSPISPSLAVVTEPEIVVLSSPILLLTRPPTPDDPDIGLESEDCSVIDEDSGSDFDSESVESEESSASPSTPDLGDVAVHLPSTACLVTEAAVNPHQDLQCARLPASTPCGAHELAVLIPSIMVEDDTLQLALSCPLPLSPIDPMPSAASPIPELISVIVNEDCHGWTARKAINCAVFVPASVAPIPEPVLVRFCTEAPTSRVLAPTDINPLPAHPATYGDLISLMEASHKTTNLQKADEALAIVKSYITQAQLTPRDARNELQRFAMYVWRSPLSGMPPIWRETLEYKRVQREWYAEQEIYVDASTTWGVGIVSGNKWLAWKLKAGWQGRGQCVKDIMWAEMVAVEMGIRAFIECLNGCDADRSASSPAGSSSSSASAHSRSSSSYPAASAGHSRKLTIYSDNTGVIHHLAYPSALSLACKNYVGISPGLLLMKDSVTTIHELLREHGLQLDLRWVSTRDNLADGPSRGLGLGSAGTYPYSPEVPAHLRGFLQPFV